MMGKADITLHVSDYSFETKNSSHHHPHMNEKIFRIAFGSCHKRKWALRHQQQQQQQQEEQTKVKTTIWDIIQGNYPDMFLWIGDTVYPPNHGIASREELEKEYYQMANNDTYGYSTFHPPLGIYGTWDDHDYGANDAGKELMDKVERRRLFWDFLKYPQELQSKLSIREGLYHSIDIVLPNNNNNSSNTNENKNGNNHPSTNTIKILVLDTRWNRDYHCIPSLSTKIPYLGNAISCVLRWIVAGTKRWSQSWLCSSSNTILGTEQWEWLSHQLETSTAQFHILVSSIQVLSTNPAMEGWGHFPQEQEKLLQLLYKWNINHHISKTNNNNNNRKKGGFILLSGDVHHAELINPPGMSSFYEITSSGLTHTCTMPFYGKLCEPLLKRYGRHRQPHSSTNHEDITFTKTNHDGNHDYNNNYYLDRNFGTLDIDWASEQWNVNIQDANGDIVLSTGWKSWYMYPDVSWSTLNDFINAIPKTTNDDLIPYVFGGMLFLIFILASIMLVVGRYLAPRTNAIRKEKKN